MNLVTTVKSFTALLGFIIAVASSKEQLPLKVTTINYETIFEWKQVDFKFKTKTHRDEAIKSGEFIPENNVITGIKVSGYRAFLTVPRWRSGVPATLNYVAYNRSANFFTNMEPLLLPYPSWEHNQVANCSVLQYVQSMEIDQFNRMWIADVGRRNIFEAESDNSCPPKLVIIDLNTDQPVHSYVFPSEVVAYDTSFLNDLVVGCSDNTNMNRCVVYISDASDAKIVAYDLAANKSWFVQHESMLADPEAVNINIHGKKYTFNMTIDGIALSPRQTNFSKVYYSPLSSLNVYSLLADTVKQAGNSGSAGIQLKDSDVTHVGSKTSQSDGMIIDANGFLYYGLVGTCSINRWNSSLVDMTDLNQQIVAHSDIDLQWPDTFSINDDGYLFVTPNRLHLYVTKTLNFTDINFRVVRTYINCRNYMFNDCH